MTPRYRIGVLLAGAALLLAACGRSAPAPSTGAQPSGQAPAAQKPAATEDVAAFYRGKTVTLLVHVSAGGGYDLYARIVAEHMKKHIPGAPNMIVQNMPGGGGMVAANHLFNAARKDGTVIATQNRGLPQAELAGTEGVQYKSREFNWLGSVNEEVSVCVARADSGISRFDDVYTRTLRVGGTGPGADTDFFPEVLNVILGTKFDTITGYPGGNEINIALERGELQGRCGWSWSSVVSTRAQWLQDPKFINILLQMALNKHSDPRLQSVPLVLELAKSPADREVMELLFARQTMGRPYLAPPGIPPARVQALREAFMKTMEDPEFVADMEKAKLELNPVGGQQVQQLVDRMFNSRPELIERFKKVYTEAGGGA